MVGLVVGIVLVGAGLAMLLGLYRIVAEAFHDSAFLGVLVMLLPPVLVGFVLYRWTMCWPGTKRLAVGGAVFALGWAYGVPAVYASGDARRLANVVAIAEEAHDAPYKCPEEPKLTPGYAAYCCTRKGWQLVGGAHCSATYGPRTSCEANNLGAVEQTVCGTVGPPIGPIAR